MASSSDSRFTGKVALVTGSSSGIGEAIAVHLARLGASVTLCGRNLERLDAAREKCVQASGGQADRFITVPGNVKELAYLSEVVDATVEKFGRLDILVCNAGASEGNSGLTEATEAMFDSLVSVFLKSVFFLIQKAVPHLEKSKGNIINISSIMSTLVSEGGIVYSSLKAAIDHMTRCLALDLAPRNIRVNAVKPSFVMTRIFRSQASEEENRASLEAYGRLEVKVQPLGHRLLTVEELAEAVVFLASDSASFITGQTLTVDGGRSFTGPLTTE